MKRKYSAILGNLGNTCDRFLSSGYKDQPSKSEMMERAASIPEVTGIELVGTWDITKENQSEIKELLEKHNLTCASIIPDHFSQKIWGNGAFTSRNADVRKKAIEATIEAIDIAANLQCPLVNIWPGQDGYDYPLQGDFENAYNWIIDAIRECADHNTDIKLALEYKIKEPRTHSYLATATNTLMICEEIDKNNVGVCIDFGHALMAYENVAESAYVLGRKNKLFHLHFNDNYRAWDDDMIVGSIHTIEYLEMLLWTRKIRYDGWFSMDLYPYREDAKEAISESILWLKSIENLIDKYGEDNLYELINKGIATDTSKELRKLILNA